MSEQNRNVLQRLSSQSAIDTTTPTTGLESSDLNPINLISKIGNLLKNGRFSKEDSIINESKTLSGSYYTNIYPYGDSQQTAEFLQRIVELMYVYIDKINNRGEKILNFEYPHDLKNRLDLAIPRDPHNLQQIVEDCHMAMKCSVKTGHPRFFNQLSQGLDVISLAGEWVTATTNTNMFTYEIAPFYTLIEEVVLNKMRECIGWTESGDGLFNPGGSISNLYAVQAAKHYYFPQTKYVGMFNMPKLVVFTSEHSHYSVQRAVAILGLGTNQVRSVPVDNRGKMIPERLEEMIIKCIDDKEAPFCVMLTCGTTVLGSFDPIEPVSEICKKYNMWLHVDAAWGGGALLSRKHRHLLKGIENADSVTWNPHKLMGALLQCSAFLVKRKNVLLSCNEMNASYLFQQDKHYDVNYDTGDKTIQCGRHVDVFKVWLMWRAKGDSGFEKQIDRLFDLAKLLHDQVKQRDNFELVLTDPEYTNVCFWYVPKSLKNMDRSSDEFKNKLNKIAPQIKKRMMMKGSLMVGYQPLDDKPNFFRAIISNQASSEEDILFMLDEIENLGKDL